MATSLVSTSEVVFRCPMCTFVCLDPNEWLAHLRTGNHDNFSVSCCFDDCSHVKPFTTFSGLKSHIYHTHYQEKVSNGGASETDDERSKF